MKQVILCILFISCFLGAIASWNDCLRAGNVTENRDHVLEESGKDSCLPAYLAKNDLQDYTCWNLVFENTTQDTLLMLTRFQYDRYSSGGRQGFMVYSYSDRKSFMQEMETYQEDYYISVQDTTWRNAV